MKIITYETLLQEFEADYFSQLSSLGALSSETVIWLLQQGGILQLAAEEEVFHAGSRAESFYIILSGTVSLYRHVEASPVRVRSFSPGQQTGFASMIALHGYKNTAVVGQPGYILRISADLFFELHIVAPQDFGIFLLNLSREMARTIGKMGDQIEDLSDQMELIREKP
ncbi:MAG: cyclic nucleotide-binding domain-containing protein [Amphritea sp.]